MTGQEEVETFDVDEWSNPQDVYEAECTECGTAARFESAGGRSLGETFKQICYNCSSGRFLVWQDTHEFRVIDTDPDLDASPIEPAQVPVYQSNDAV